MKNIINNPIFSISGYLFGILGILITIVFYFKSKQKRKIAYYLQNFRLLDRDIKKISKVSISYDNLKIENFTVTNICVWNYGNTTINGTDIASFLPIELSIDNDGLILDYQIIISDKANNWNLINLNNKIKIEFDYIDQSEGCKFQIYHTGNNITLSGKIKGGTIKEESLIEKTDTKRWKIISIFCLFCGIAGTSLDTYNCKGSMVISALPDYSFFLIFLYSIYQLRKSINLKKTWKL